MLNTMFWNTMSEPVSPEMFVSCSDVGSAVKQEVKSHVLNQRRKRGLPDIEIKEEKSKVKQELSQYEIEKRERRKAQNRKAAEKCRKKKQQENHELAKNYEEEVVKNKVLLAENLQLQQERDRLQQFIERHQFVCQRVVTPSPNNTPGFENQPHFDFNTGMPCTTGYPVVDPLSILRETATPFQTEEESDVFGSNDFYPSTLCSDQIKPEFDCSAPPFAVANLPSLPLLGELDLVDILSPLSPEQFCQLGRQSISDYQEV